MKFDLTNTKALQLFQILRQGGFILTAVFLTKSHLNLTDIGAYEMLMYVAYTLSFWWVTGLVQGLLSQYPQYDAINQRQLLTSAYLFFTGISIAIFVIVFVFQPQILSLLVGQSSLRYFEIFLVFMLFNFPTFLLENLMLLEEKPRAIFWLGVYTFAAQLLAVLVPVYAGWGLRWSIVGLAITAGIKHIWLLTNVWQYGSWRWRGDLVKQWGILSFPLVLYALLGGFNTAFDNWLVNHHFTGNAAIFAIFRYGAQELPLTLALTGAFSNAMLPEVAKDLQGALAAIKLKSLKLFHLLFPLSILVVLTDRWLFPLIFNPAFVASVDVFNIYLLILISRMVFSRPILVGLQANKEVLVISVIELIVNVITSFIMVQYFGLAGIVLGTLIAYTLEKILLCALLYVRFGIPVQAYTDLRWFSLYAIALLSVFLIAM